MKVFISYGSIPDQVTALRLQALGAVSGLTIYVPPAYTRQLSPQLLSFQPFSESEVFQKLRESEVVLGVIGTAISEACRQELDTGLQLKKTMIVMAYPDMAQQLQPFFPTNLIVIDPFNPAAAETAILQYLKGLGMGAQQDTGKALLALGALVLGLLMIASFANRDA